jgi:hypothetical protein
LEDIPVTTLIIVILVNPVNGILKTNESRYVAGNRLQAKQIITTKILPEKHKYSEYQVPIQ